MTEAAFGVYGFCTLETYFLFVTHVERSVHVVLVH